MDLTYWVRFQILKSYFLDIILLCGWGYIQKRMSEVFPNLCPKKTMYPLFREIKGKILKGNFKYDNQKARHIKKL